MIFNERFQFAATDLSNHLACHHLTKLNAQVARGECKGPTWRDPSLDVLIQRGKDHEQAYVEHLRTTNRSVENLNGKSRSEVERAMRDGVGVLVQVRLDDEPWMGFADILIKVPRPSRFGNWSYEVQDTKLAQNTRAATILQLCIYTDLLCTLQGSEPEFLHVVKPGENFPTETFRYAAFRAYYKLIRDQFEKFPASTPPTYPDPVEHCAICSWWQQCDKKRHDDDHLSLVAGIRSLHIVELNRQSISTLEKFATTSLQEKPERGSWQSFIRKQQQARVQLQGRIERRLIQELLKPERGRGFERLPQPTDGDIYFDIEGDAFYEDGGLEYLLGYAFKESGQFVYQKVWARNRVEEKEAFREFMTFVVERWKRYPWMYIYHFAPYEPTAVKRLARVHALFEREVDDLLRAERFIDLHAVFKESMLASVESYSLKELEKFTTYTRMVALHDASVARKTVEVALELKEGDTLLPATIKAVEDYNEDDCRATAALHSWLEDIRKQLIAEGRDVPRPEIKSPDASDNVDQLETRSLALYKSLTGNLPEDRAVWKQEHHAKWLLAHLIDYFRREDKSAWWEYFHVHEMETEDLFDERKAITGLSFVMELPKEKGQRNPTRRYQYPPQETSIDEGDDLFVVKGKRFGTVIANSIENSTIDIKLTGAAANDIPPVSVHVQEIISPGALATSLHALAQDIDENGLDHLNPYHAAKDLLMKRKPRMVGGFEGAYPDEGEDTVAAASRLALQLDKSVLAIQGPPGTGKTYTGAKMIIELVKAGKRVGVTAISHKVIRNLTLETIRLATKDDYPISFVHKIKEFSQTPLPHGLTEVDKSEKVLIGLNEGKVGCGTAWLWAEENSVEKLDYLFVDEAGQMSLSHVLAASRAAKNLILLGDPQQLEQPQKGAHPEGSDVAALTYLLDGHPTMPDGKGLFLGVTRRLHPNICAFTSHIYYEGRLTSLPGLEHQAIGGNTGFDGAGLFFVPVMHKGNQNSSKEEVGAIAAIADRLLTYGTWTDSVNKTRKLEKSDIKIVAPFNAQVGALRERLPGLEIGTVDKFQGQEAAVIIYSMTCSTAEDAPRGMSFLYSPNRLNVATSRARGACIIVASPALLEANCRSIEQMKWINGLVHYTNIATKLTMGLQPQTFVKLGNA